MGNTDSRYNLYKAIYDVLKSSISTTLQHAYTVKINEYATAVNLGSSSDVRTHRLHLTGTIQNMPIVQIL